MHIIEPQREIRVLEDTDLCVVGGSCTGVFAAVRAARLGARVVLVEMQSSLGGTAAAGLVNMWHNLSDLTHSKQIIAGLTYETLQRLDSVGALTTNKDSMSAYRFNSNDLKIELDGYIHENKIKLYLHSRYSSVIAENGLANAVIIQTKEGRGAIKAKFVIDATGDGDIARDLGISSYTNEVIQNPTSCFLISGCTSGINKIIREHGHEEGLDNRDWGWGNSVPGCEKISMCAHTHIFGARCDKTDELTYAEMEGRRHVRAVQRLLIKYGAEDSEYGIVAINSHIGVRETVHYESLFKVEGNELVSGRKYPDAVMNGTYPSDIHDNDGGFKIEGIKSDYYQIPFGILPTHSYKNFIAVGRMLNADSRAFGALRVMVNLNQLGEAAGVAAYMCLSSSSPVKELDGVRVREKLVSGGSSL